MEAVLAELVFLRDRLIYRICAYMLWDRIVEGRVEVCDIPRVRQDICDCAHDAQSRGVVQGRQITELFNVMVGFFVDDLRAGVITAMNDTVTGKVNVFLIVQLWEALVFGQVIQDEFESVFLR